MQWTEGTYSGTLWSQSDYAAFLRLDPDVAAQSSEQTLIAAFEQAAVAYAENTLGISLLTRTVTATYYMDDAQAGTYPNLPVYAYCYPLPQGPVQSLTSVTDAVGAITGSTIEGYGAALRIVVPGQWTPPLTVVYVAGYGNASAVPSDIKHAIRAHVGFLYENRGEMSVEAPKWLDSFYAARSRNTGVG